MALTTRRGKKAKLKWGIFFSAAFLQLASGACFAEQIRVATASNFRTAMTSLAAHFEQNTGHEVQLIFGSTGKHYAQIIHGAPFDAFFAADAKRPALLEQNGLAVSGSRITYAQGQLVLFSPGISQSVPDAGRLQNGNFRHLAIANPKLAPYGRAAAETLESLGLMELLKQRLVIGENVGQTFQFVISGNAELGFVARSQLISQTELSAGNYWLVPTALHQPIEQQAVLLNDFPAAREFMLYVRSDEAITVIREHGYLAP